jgi:hypothetical protein
VRDEEQQEEEGGAGRRIGRSHWRFGDGD